MAFTAGIDLGTTFTAAALNRDGLVEMFRLGSSSFTIPSVLYFGEAGAMTTGETARRRLTTEPDRVAHEFKRRMGDPAPLMIGGAPYAAHLLTGRLLDWVVDRIEEQEGSRPELVSVTHPANWGPFRRELMDQAIKAAEVARAVTVTEPEAAAIAYASSREVAIGSKVAVYDLGGGTFDAAVLDRTAGGFELIGTPDGVEHLGGLDFDATLFGMVVEQHTDEFDRLDPQEPSVRAAVQRLREECVSAKIALSTDTDTTIPVILPGFETQIRVNRAEFEQRITPLLQETIGALGRTLRSAGIVAADLDRVLLVGGSSRIPIVGRLVTQELGRPVALDADPKNAIARGAAIHAHQQLTGGSATFTSPASPAPPASAAPPAPTPPAPTPSPKPAAAPKPSPPPTTPPNSPAAPQPVAAPVPVPRVTPAPMPAPSVPAAAAALPTGGKPKTPLLIAGAVLVVALIAGGLLLTQGGSDDGPPSTGPTTTEVALDRDNILAVEVGDCINIDGRGNVDNVSCRSTNIGEVFHIFESELGPNSNDPFPGIDPLLAEGVPVCDNEIESFADNTPDTPFVADLIASDEEEWEEFGSRRLLCVAEPATQISAFRPTRCYDRRLGEGTFEITLTITECVEPFFGTVYFAGAFGNPPADFPGADALFVEAIPQCEAQFEPQTGTSVEAANQVTDTIIPNEAEWDLGFKSFACGSFNNTGIVSFSPGQCTTKNASEDDPTLSFVLVSRCVTVENGQQVVLPHDGEVFAQVPLSGGEDDVFPGAQAIFIEAQPLCDAAFEGYVGTPVNESTLFPTTVSPSEGEWDDLKVRTAACVAERIDGELLEVGVQNSGL